MSGYKGPIGKYVRGEMDKQEFINYLKSAKPGSEGGKKRKSLRLGEDGDGVLDAGSEFGFARMVGDISDEEYEEFFNALG